MRRRFFCGEWRESSCRMLVGDVGTVKAKHRAVVRVQHGENLQLMTPTGISEPTECAEGRGVDIAAIEKRVGEVPA